MRDGCWITAQIADRCWGCEQVFLNIVLDEAVEEKAGGEKVRIGMVVRYPLSPEEYRQGCVR